MSAISVKNLTVKYGKQTVLDRLSFDVEKGQIVALIGPNGSGKTTVFRALLNLVPYEGSIKIFQKPVGDVLHRIGYVPQHFDFDRTLPITVNELLSFANSPGTQKMADKICREVKIDALSQRLIGELSGGQLQRVLIAQALLKSPDLLLMDEPSSGIDIEGTRAFYDLVKHVNQEHGVTVLLISHEVKTIHTLADQILCLNRELICDGAPHEVLNDETMEKLYGSDADHKSHKHI